MQYLLECHLLSHTDRHEQRKRVSQPVLCSEPRTGASGQKNVSPPTTGLQKRSVMAMRFRRETILFFLFISKRADCSHSKACLWKGSSKYSKIWMRRANLVIRNSVSRCLFFVVWILCYLVMFLVFDAHATLSIAKWNNNVKPYLVNAQSWLHTETK